ncbi:MAG: VWA domain-containing protein [Deltaproteobacteria bacterium]|nr:VWA domain-containing protein [Deltaproteobacteria bacterium]
MSARRRRLIAPPPLPERRESDWERRLTLWLPYLMLLVAGLLVTALALHHFPWSQKKLVLTLPRGTWAIGVRRFLGWYVLPVLTVGLAVWAGLVLWQRRTPTMKFSRVSDLAALGQGIRAKIVTLPNVLRLTVIGLWSFALLGPQLKTNRVLEDTSRGIDIMVVLDVSGSMSARDLLPNRLDAAKRVIDDFVGRRKHDRIGLVLFAKEAYWWCPLTLDHTALRTMLANVQLGVINPRGTAIGDAIGTALNRLRRSKTKSKVIILLTDGDNNAGILMPRKAEQYARTLAVRIYTILMGLKGQQSLFGMRNPVNPKLLAEIATTTGGVPYLAGDTRSLRNRFHRILNRLEKDKLPARYIAKYEPIQQWFVGFGLLLLLLELGLSLTVLRRFP